MEIKLMINIDGSAGEGGGQVLRTSLALSMVTNQPFSMKNIRANRSKPGLLRQHLTAVKAAAAVSCAHVSGASLGSDSIEFTPGTINAGKYHFSIGSAGSTTLVLQTILPALIRAPGPSEVTIEGGTHNPYAPTIHFLKECFLPVLERMGPRVDVELVRHGFFPAGGGKIRVRIDPSPELKPVELNERGDITNSRVIATIAGLPGSIADRELDFVKRKLSLSQDQIEHDRLEGNYGPGNVLTLLLETECVTEVITSFGELGKNAERVARQAVKQANDYVSSGVPVGRYLADQLLVLMAIAGSGEIKTGRLTRHTVTNMDVIHQFVGGRFSTTEFLPGRHHVRFGS
jgi:RNA 3'-terminal phosphate cyclase (ATP)